MTMEVMHRHPQRHVTVTECSVVARHTLRPRHTHAPRTSTSTTSISAINAINALHLTCQGVNLDCPIAHPLPQSLVYPVTKQTPAFTAILAHWHFSCTILFGAGHSMLSYSFATHRTAGNRRSGDVHDCTQYDVVLSGTARLRTIVSRTHSLLPSTHSSHTCTLPSQPTILNLTARWIQVHTVWMHDLPPPLDENLQPLRTSAHLLGPSPRLSLGP